MGDCRPDGGALGGLGEINTRKECAAFLKVTPKTVDREIKRGKLGCVRVGRSVRITRGQIMAYIERQGAQVD